MRHARIISEVVRQPWAILDAKFDAIIEVLARAEAGEVLTEAEIRERVGERKVKAKPYLLDIDTKIIAQLDAYEAAEAVSQRVAAANGSGTRAAAKLVAVLPVYGIIVDRVSSLDISETGTGIDALAKQFRSALANPDVKSIVFDFNSPGGSVYGVDEFAQEIFDARDQKRIVAQVSPLCASAAYYLASQCPEIVITPSGEAGSIGVRSMWVGMQKALALKGFEVKHFSAGKYKVEGNPHEPLTEDAGAFMQQRVNEYYDMFVKAVARGRDVKVSDVKNGFGEGRVLGAVEAKRLGMVDRVATLDETLTRLGAAADSQRVQMSAPTATDVLPTATAETKKEVLMDPVVTTAAAAADSALSVGLLEAKRCEKIMQLAQMHNMIAKAEGWMTSKASVESVQAEILAAMKPVTVLQPAAEQRAAGSAARTEFADGRKGPFASLGEQMIAIAHAGMPGGRVDERLYKVHEISAATGQSSGVPSDGGFLVQTDFSPELMQRSYETGALTSRCSRTEIGANSDSLEVPYVDETDRATGSRWGGITVARSAEAGLIAASKAKLGKWECRLEDLVGAIFVTERLLRDAPAMTSFVNEAFGQEFGFVLDDEVYEGDGVGKCLGILNSKALVTIAKEAGQAAATVLTENIVKMWAAFYARSRSSAGAAWFYNQELDSQLPLLNVGVGTAGQPVYMAPGGLSGKPYSTLYGLPMIAIEQAAAPGTVGDIVLADLGEYKLIEKGGLQTAESIHVKFLNLERCYRFVTSVNGAPKWKTSLKPFKGSTAFRVSPFVALAAR